LADYYLKLINLKNVQTAKDAGLSQHLIVKSAELCFEAAHEMIDVLYSRFDLTTVTGPVPAWWFAVLCKICELRRDWCEIDQLIDSSRLHCRNCSFSRTP